MMEPDAQWVLSQGKRDVVHKCLSRGDKRFSNSRARGDVRRNANDKLKLFPQSSLCLSYHLVIESPGLSKVSHSYIRGTWHLDRSKFLFNPIAAWAVRRLFGIILLTYSVVTSLALIPKMYH